MEKKAKNIVEEINIPTAGNEEIKSYFDNDIEEFTLADDAFDAPEEMAEAPEYAQEEVETVAANDIPSSQIGLSDDDFTWVLEADAEEKGFKNIYFEFDKFAVAPEQREALDNDITVAKNILGQDAEAVVVVEGHSCTSAGSKTYNLALSEKRAKIVADLLIEQGIEANRIKIVGRGSEMPALNEFGDAVTGDRYAQAPNRRTEIHIVQS